jgi:PTS hybrid protein
VILLYDLGDTQMIAELVAEGRADNSAYVVESPLVEGGVVAAIAAAEGAGLDDVASAASSAGSGGEIEEAGSGE